MSQTVAIRARDADIVSTKFLGDMAPNDKATFQSIFQNIATNGSNINPGGVEFRDGVVYFSTFYTSGLIQFRIEQCRDINDTEQILGSLNTDFVLTVGLDDDGHITRLTVDVGKSEHLLEVTAAIGRLKRLKRLCVYNCQSHSHRELSKLPHLECLRLWRCSESLNNFPLDMAFPRLEKLQLTDFCLPVSMALFPWITEHFPSLKSLVFSKVKCTSVAFDLPDTGTFKSRIESINMQNCSVGDDQLESLLFDALPNLPALSRISLRYNNIQTLRPIAKRIINEDYHGVGFKSGLVELSLLGNPIEHNCRDHKIRMDLCSFIRAFPSIEALGAIPDLHRDVASELLLNRAGRRLVNGWTSDRPLPLSVWPLVLGRINSPCFFEHLQVNGEKKMEYVATGLFYLLREGPCFLR